MREEGLRARVGELPLLRVEAVAEVAALRDLVVAGHVRLAHVLVREGEQGARGGPDEGLRVRRPLVVRGGRLRAELAPGHEVAERAGVGPGVERPALPRHLPLRANGPVHARAHAPQEDARRGVGLPSREARPAAQDVHHPADRVAAVERRAGAAHHLDAIDRVRGDRGEVLVGPVPEGRVAEADAVHHQQDLVPGQAPDEGRPAAVVRLLHEDAGHPGERLGRRAERPPGQLVALEGRHRLRHVERPPLVSLRGHGDRLVDPDEQGLEHEVDRLAPGRRLDLDAPVPGPRGAQPVFVPAGCRTSENAPSRELRRLVGGLRELEEDPVEGAARERVPDRAANLAGERGTGEEDRPRGRVQPSPVRAAAPWVWRFYPPVASVVGGRGQATIWTVGSRARAGGTGVDGAAGGETTLVEAIAAGIAHEVRNPLNALQINLGILEQELSEMVPDRGSHVFEVIGKIAGELRSLDNFVTEFLRFARPPRPALEPVAVRPLLADLVTFIGPECSGKGVSLSLTAEGGPETAMADPFQLKHAVLNLVLNALQATPAGGAIEIETGGDARTLEVRVRDTGQGIGETVLPRVFDAFFTTREGGTGLGLPIARRIVEAHGGTLPLRSHEGEGTVATLSLPVAHGAR